MILSFLSWVLIFTFSFILGFGILFFVMGKTDINSTGSDYILVWGLCAATVYAQVFSLFHQVGRLAVLLLTMISLVIFLALLRQIFGYISFVIHNKRNVIVLTTILIGGGYFALAKHGDAIAL